MRKMLVGQFLACVVVFSVHAQSPSTGSIIDAVVVDETIGFKKAPVCACLAQSAIAWPTVMAKSVE